MWGRFTLLDIVLAAYFLFFFEPRLIGYIVAFILGIRILIDGYAVGDHLVFDMRKKRAKH